MMSFGAPWWLLGIASVPLVWWLHHWRAPLTRVPVSALFIWSGRAAATKAGSRQPTPDPAWRRRALFTALLTLALAQPGMPREDEPITVWVDDTLSMATSEAGEPRLTTALRELADALEGAPSMRIILRSLSNPAKSVVFDAPDALNADTWLSTEPATPDPPPSGLMQADSSHWLLSDGASEATAHWAGSAPLARVIANGAETENVAITRVAARRNVADPLKTDLLVSVFNAGYEDATRELRVQADASVMTMGELPLAPGETRHAELTLDGLAGRVTALLDPGDALSADDELSLGLQSLAPVPVDVDASCPGALRRALGEHGGLVAASAATTLAVSCSDRPTDADAILRFHIETPSAVESSPTWLPAAGRLTGVPLRRGWLAASGWPAGTANAKPLLVAGESPLAVLGVESKRRVDTVIDPGRAEFVAQPEYAAFVAGLIDVTLGHEVLDPVAIVTRDRRESRIAPSRLEASLSSGTAKALVTNEFAGVLLALAMLVLAFDIFLVSRAHAGARHA